MKPKHFQKEFTTQYSQTNIAFKQQRLDKQMIRIRIIQQLKHIQQPWLLKQKPLCQYFNHYQVLPQSIINPQSLFKQKHVRLIRLENKIYFGQIIGKIKHGIGITLYKHGKVYEGQYINNEKSGYGCQIYSNGNFYFGQFSQNKKHGKGTFYWFNLSEPVSEKYQSQFVQHYTGQWWGGLPDGFGAHQKANGDYYEGKFKNGLKHGKGKQLFYKGDIYEGNYTNGLFQGYGQYLQNQGAFYKGQFKQGFKNGYGIWKKGKNSKEIYKGHYLLDQKHGYGIYDWGNGYVYKGNFFHDLRSGQGQLYFKGQLTCKGSWINGQTSDQLINKKQRKKIKTKVKNCFLSKGYSKTVQRPKFSANKLINSEIYMRNLSFTKKNSFFHTKSNKFYTSFNPQHSFEEISQSHHHKQGHKNCIPHLQYGKMPKPVWQNLRHNQKIILNPKKYQNKNKRYI